MNKAAQLTLQRWGNSLAVRIPAMIARSAHFAVGQPVELTLLENSGVAVRPAGPLKLSLKQKLAHFDPNKHGGEAMVTGRLGKEVFNDEE